MAALQRTGVIKPALLQPWMDEWRASLSTDDLARRFVQCGFKAVLVCVDPRQIDVSHCGSDFDAALLNALPSAADPCGERGEFHTLSYGGPLFKADLSLRRGESVLRDGRFQFTDFLLEAPPA